ncbi:hypothetical protein FG152_13575 [Ochrobactrum sp. XJ1]|nr:hypothetical protein [Ochrobactrum sp. XJ1]
MAKIEKFTIRNFKGISSTTIDLSSRLKNDVLTFIGLNESGKTTVLEAISYFVTSERENSTIFEGPYAQRQIASLIPIHQQAAFTDSIEIDATVVLDAQDKEVIRSLFETDGLNLDIESIPDKFKVQKAMKFTNSKPTGSSNYWIGIQSLRVSRGKSKKYIDYQRPKKDEPRRDLWLEMTTAISERLPRVTYFPTFLVDLPSKIYLKEHENERPVNRYYRNVIQDILKSIDNKLDLNTHVIQRILDFKEADGTQSWFSKFFSQVDRRPVESVFQKISAAITKEVLGNWQRVFNTPVGAKQITIDWNIDTENGDIPYCTFNVSDGESLYQIDQRSLGFRWFFSFLLFTRFKAAKERATIFLFDEPAANLHARAQAQLLESFQRIVDDGNMVFYSTHSHHMINPRWLSGAFIVENEAINYDSADYATSFSVTPTRIKVSNYRDFVSQQPDRMSYFQPVLERLQYQEPILVGNGPQILVEGITDFYLFEYVRLKSKKFPNLRFLPGYGAASLNNAIGRAMSEGRKFLILLDDDKAGKSSKDKYLADWSLFDGVANTLADIDPKLSGKKLEDLIQQETKEKIKKRFDGKSGKRQINFYLAECLSSLEDDAIDSDTFNLILDIVSNAYQKLNA